MGTEEGGFDPEAITLEDDLDDAEEAHRSVGV